VKKHTIVAGIGLFTLVYQSLAVENFPITTDFGRTGLISIPSAYTIQDGNLLFGFSRTYPYTRGFLGFGFIPRFEGGIVITQIDNISFKNDPVWKNYGKYKDKAFFAKFQLIPETETLPALAIGYDDFHGTKLFETKYITATKFVDFVIPQNITIGYGSGKLDGVFGGTEILLHPKVSFLAEYAPYKTEKMIGFRQKKLKNSEKVNYGINYHPYKWLSVSGYVERQDLGFTISLNAPLGGGLPKIPKHFILSEEDVKEIKEGKQESFYAKALERLDLKYAEVWQDGDVLNIEYSNKGYLFESIALKKALDVLRVTYFPGVKTVRIIIKENNVPITSIEIPGYVVNAYLNKKVELDYLLQKTKSTIAPDYKPKYSFIFDKPELSGNVKIRTFLNDPSGAFKYQLSYDIGIKENLLNNFSLTSTLSIPIINNISTINQPLMNPPVRSDVADYLKQKKPRLYNLSFNYLENIGKILPRTFATVSAGYNEMMFAGVGGDILHFVGDGRLAFGVGGDYVYKRDPESIFKLKNDRFHDYYLNFYYSFKEPEIKVNIKMARFLAGDEGVRFQVSRVVKGFEIGFWWTKSNTNKPQFYGDNRGYSDKGIFITIPFRVFFTKDTYQTASYSLSPWTRDVGQLSYRPIDLYNTVRPKLPFYLLDTYDEKE